MLGKKLVSTTYRLSSSCARQSVFSTGLSGSLPNRHVPAWWATPATGNVVLETGVMGNGVPLMDSGLGQHGFDWVVAPLRGLVVPGRIVDADGSVGGALR